MGKGIGSPGRIKLTWESLITPSPVMGTGRDAKDLVNRRGSHKARSRTLWY